jgi:hypothetical protein
LIPSLPATTNPAAELKASYFRRLEEVCGKNSNGLGKKLLAAHDGIVPLARAAVEVASTKFDPREYIGAIIRKPSADEERASDPRPDRSW